MGKCANPRYEQMIHSFELGLLAEDDRRDFEQHLLECEYCFEQVKAFLPASMMMRHDSEIRQDSLAPVSSTTWLTRLRLLAVAALLLAVLVPAYFIGFRDQGTSDIVQQLRLLPVRGGNVPVLYLDQGGLAEIRFALEAAGPETVCRMKIASRAGVEIISDDEYSGFDTTGVGVITIPIDEFEVGFYTLTVTALTGSLPTPRRTYNFRVE